MKEFIPDHWKEQARRVANAWVTDSEGRALLFDEILTLLDACCQDLARMIMKDMGKAGEANMIETIRSNMSDEDKQETAATMRKALLERGADPDEIDAVLKEVLGIESN